MLFVIGGVSINDKAGERWKLELLCCVVIDVNLYCVVIDVTMCCRWPRSDCLGIVGWSSEDVEVFPQGWPTRSLNM